jgi:hypothetical protein
MWQERDQKRGAAGRAEEEQSGAERSSEGKHQQGEKRKHWQQAGTVS